MAQRSTVAILAAILGLAVASPEGLHGARRDNSTTRLRGFPGEQRGLSGKFVLSKRYDLSKNPSDEFDVVVIPDQNLTHSCSNYVDDGSTVFSRDGKLVLKVSEACKGGTCLNSGRIMSKRAYKYGVFTFSAKVPKCNGIWPALWMLPGNTDGEGKYGAWPCSGEIDILETVDKQSVGAFNLVAGYGAGQENTCGGQPVCNQCGRHAPYCTSTTMKDLEGSFYEVEEVDCSAQHPSWQEHLFVLNWQPGRASVYVDPQLTYDAQGHLVDIIPKPTPLLSQQPGGEKQHPFFKEYLHESTETWGAVSDFMESCHAGVAGLGAPFDQEMKLVLNIAVGGYGGAPCQWGSHSCTAPGACGGAVGSELELSDISVWEWEA